MAPMSRLVELANSIQKQVFEVQEHLTATGQGDPSFDGQVQPTDFEGVDETRSAVLENLTELQDLLSTPRELLRAQMVSKWIVNVFLDRFAKAQR